MAGIVNIAEVGVYKGEGAKQMAEHWPDASLWLFDTFTGHQEPSEFDDAKAHPKGRYSDTSVKEVQEKYPKALILNEPVPKAFRIFSPTWIDEEPVKFRFVRIDVDHYYPTKVSCEFFKSRMEPGGIIEFDDYLFGECPGATKAIDEVFGREHVLPGEGNFPTNSYHWVSP